MTAVTLAADDVLQALIIMRSSIKLSLTVPSPVWMMYTSSPRTLSRISTLVSLLANFLVTTSLGWTPNLSQTKAVRWGWELPEKILIPRMLHWKEPVSANHKNCWGLSVCHLMLTASSVQVQPVRHWEYFLFRYSFVDTRGQWDLVWVPSPRCWISSSLDNKVFRQKAITLVIPMGKVFKKGKV